MNKEKHLMVDGYGARGKVKKVKDGYDMVITVSFISKFAAEGCLQGLNHLREVSNELVS